MCRALYYFPPLSTPSNSRFQSSDQWPSNFLSHASSLDLCVIIVIVIFFTYKHLFDFVTLPLYCIIFSQFVFAIIYILTVIGYEHTHSVRLFALFSLLMHFV